MTPTEIDRLARMTAAIRPDWPVQSLRTALTNFTHAHPHRSYGDTAHALLEIALDPATKSPGRLAENGPWWQTRPAYERPSQVFSDLQATKCDFPGHGWLHAGEECDRKEFRQASPDVIAATKAQAREAAEVLRVRLAEDGERAKQVRSEDEDEAAA